MIYTSEATDRETIERVKRDYQSLMQAAQQLMYFLKVQVMNRESKDELNAFISVGEESIRQLDSLVSKL